jgi:hypothetical protein
MSTLPILSKRPTTLAQQALIDLTSANSFGYAIIGDTVAATLYAKRLLGNGITTPITVISEGVDRTSIQDLLNVAFAAIHNRRILHHLMIERVHMVPVIGSLDVIDFAPLVPAVERDLLALRAERNFAALIVLAESDLIAAIPQIERIIHYHVGSGPLGDFIAAYHTPRLGPWFGSASAGHLERFLVNHTIKSALTSQEMTVVNRLQQIWGLPTTSSLVVKHPAILNVHYEFIRQIDDTFERELFLGDFGLVDQASNSSYATEATNLKFTQVTGTTGPILYDITANNVSLQSVRHVFKTNPFTHLRIATSGGLHPPPFMLPTFYRAVLSIPIGGTGATGSPGVTGGSVFVPGPPGFVCVACTGAVCLGTEVKAPMGPSGTNCFIGLTGLTGVNLVGVTGTEDLITSHITFSLHDVVNPKHSSLDWLIQAYTTVEDLSVVQQDGRFADTGRTLLIVEAVSTKNRRRATFNVAENEIQINYNDPVVENGILRQFALIVASIFNAYTGAFFSVNDLLNDTSVCSSASGICQDRNALVDYSLRESPMVTVLQLASDLYGSEIFPNR